MSNKHKNIQLSIVEMMYKSHSSHIGACLSVVDILYTLYFKKLRISDDGYKLKNKDFFVLSKAHSSAALYAVLAERGFFDKKLLSQYYINGGILPGHLDMHSVPGIEISGGSLGHGLSVAIGRAIAKKNEDTNIFVLLGDGECNEGSIWEAAMLASTLKIDNLTVIVDFNKLQGLGKTNDIINQRNLAERWRAFGWESIEIDGHNHRMLEEAFDLKTTRPKAIIAHTVKGKGVSFMENQLAWHYKSPNDEEYLLAIEELGGLA